MTEHLKQQKTDDFHKAIKEFFSIANSSHYIETLNNVSRTHLEYYLKKLRKSNFDTKAIETEQYIIDRLIEFLSKLSETWKPYLEANDINVRDLMK